MASNSSIQTDEYVPRLHSSEAAVDHASQLKSLQLIDNWMTDPYISPSFIGTHKFSNVQNADPREFFEQCLVKLNQDDPTVLSLYIDCQSITGDEITRFTDALAVNSTLLELSIRFYQLTQVVACQLVQALKLNSTLTRLSLKDNPIDDAAASQLSDIFRFNTTLLSLNLCKTELTENGISQLCAALCVNSRLIHLDLGSNPMTSRLSLSQNMINDVGAAHLSSTLMINSTLRELNLKCNKISDVGVTQLSDALMINSSLKKLNLYGNWIGDSGATRLSDAIRVNTSLEKLYLDNNPINELGATRLSEALMVNSTLIGFDIRVSPFVPRNVKEILWGKGEFNLLEKQIIPRIINNDPDLTILELQFRFLFDAQMTRLCEALIRNSTITSLDLSSRGVEFYSIDDPPRDIEDVGVARLCEVLAMNFSLLSLKLRKCRITNSGAAFLASALEKNSTLTALDLRFNKIGIQGMVCLSNSLIWNHRLTYLNFGHNHQPLEIIFSNVGQNIYVVSPRDNWIVRKNQCLFDLLFQYLYKKAAGEPIEEDAYFLSLPEIIELDDPWELSDEEVCPAIEAPEPSWSFDGWVSSEEERPPIEEAGLTEGDGLSPTPLDWGSFESNW